MKEYENYNFAEKQKDNKFLSFWKKISKYNIEAIFFLVFCVYPIILQVKAIMFPSFRFDNIYSFIITVIIVVLFLSIMQKFNIPRKKEVKKIEQKPVDDFQYKKKKIVNLQKIYLLAIGVILIDFYIFNNKLSKFLFSPLRTDWGMAIYVFVIAYLMLYFLLKDINRKKGINKELKFFSWKLLFFTFLLIFGLLFMGIVLLVFLDTFGNGSVLMF